MAYLGNNVPANFQTPPSVVRFNGDNSDTTFHWAGPSVLYKRYL